MKNVLTAEFIQFPNKTKKLTADLIQFPNMINILTAELIHFPDMKNILTAVLIHFLEIKNNDGNKVILFFFQQEKQMTDTYFGDKPLEDDEGILWFISVNVIVNLKF